MVSPLKTSPISIGLLAGEPIRLAGLTIVFDEKPMPGHRQLVPVAGTMPQLLANRDIEYLVFDLNSSGGSLEPLESVRRARPEIRLIVIGPENEEELVLDSIVAGARAYLNSGDGPETIRQAIDIVVSGSIWAPRRLLSRLIDRLLSAPGSSSAAPVLRLTSRELQVLELILLAKSNREIARQLGIEERTVKAHVSRLMKKTGAENRIELSVRALHHSLLPQAADDETL